VSESEHDNMLTENKCLDTVDNGDMDVMNGVSDMCRVCNCTRTKNRHIRTSCVTGRPRSQGDNELKIERKLEGLGSDDVCLINKNNNIRIHLHPSQSHNLFFPRLR
jgi:hypothetical protein